MLAGTAAGAGAAAGVAGITVGVLGLAALRSRSLPSILSLTSPVTGSIVLVSFTGVGVSPRAIASASKRLRFSSSVSKLVPGNAEFTRVCM